MSNVIGLLSFLFSQYLLSDGKKNLLYFGGV